MSRTVALAAGLIGAIVVGLLLTVPFLREQRRLPAVIVQPSPLFATALTEVAPNKAACIRNANIDRFSEVALFRVGTRQKPAVPLEMTVSGKGYRQQVQRPANYADNEILALVVQPPERTTSVDVCIRNEGERKIDLYGTGDTSAAPVTADIDGERIQNFTLSFYEARDATLFQRRQATAERTARFRPVGPSVVLLLALLVILAVPAALIVAIGLAAGDGSDE
jgi:hypothetical protein